jgi:hypothetical protein
MTLRVLHCPTTVGGNPQTLARAEREIGLSSWSIAFEQNYFRYEADEFLRMEGQSPLLTEIKRWEVLWRALREFDIIHFNFGQSIMPQWHPPSESLRRRHSWLKRFAHSYYARLLELRDLPLLKRAGKGIVVTYQGDDARQGDFCKANYEISPAGEVDPEYYTDASDAHKRLLITKFSTYADRTYALNPDLLRVLPPQAEFLPYANIDLRDWHPAGGVRHDLTPPVVVHAPSHRGAKGTRYVMDAISRLQAEGIPLEFILVEGVSRAEARRIYERADLLVDQVVCGWYGGLAVEFMALGKPVICYIREEDLTFIPPGMRKDLPLINANPSTLYRVAKEWLTGRKHELQGVGRRGRAYVEQWHDPLRVARRLKEGYEAIEAKMRPRGAPCRGSH